jgi:putative FmdB family regulatory protein
MPTYEYVCDNCSNQFEQYQSIHDDPLLRCSQCNKHTLRRIISGGIYVSVKKSDNEIKLGHLADRNRSRLSNDEKEHIKIKNTPDGCDMYPEKKEVPFKDNNINDYKLASLDKKQQTKYIETGIID